jgi:orotidine-5'-phosphate decarboxylase
MPGFTQKFVSRKKDLQSLLCVGLDPDPSKIPAGYSPGPAGMLEFLTDVTVATAGEAVAYKPNLAFFEVMGSAGWDLFEKVIQTVRDHAPEALIIADAKRGDIGNTARFYARTFFETFDCDALTIAPFMGPDTIEPYLEYSSKGIIALCYTSNPGAASFLGYGEIPLYEKIAESVQEMNREHKNLWMVVGATKELHAISRIRCLAPDIPFLVPGIGAQGGDLAGILGSCGADLLINSSREILYAASHRDQVIEKSREKAGELVQSVRDICINAGIVL